MEVMMSDTFGTNGFGFGGGSGMGNGGFGAGLGSGFGKTGAGIWDAMEQLRDEFERRVMPKGGARMGRGDVRAAVLALLAESPMHGYQIIHEIEERSGGSWKPSPGSVYPTLQLLTDEGLVTAEEANGRKTYALTEAGRAEADTAGERPAPWQTSAAGTGARESSGRATALPKAGVELAQAAAQVARTGTPEQVQQAVSVLEDARRKLYSILAQD
jgi:DNA-binding PadR family transcriptional regulator